MTRTWTILTLTAAAIVLSGCADYLARHDGVTFDAGDAAARNAAIHMIDPWPRHAADERIDIDGKRIAVGMHKYQTNKASDSEKPAKASAASAASIGKSSTSN